MVTHFLPIALHDAELRPLTISTPAAHSSSFLAIETIGQVSIPIIKKEIKRLENVDHLL
jgi:hypothetical protein